MKARIAVKPATKAASKIGQKRKGGTKRAEIAANVRLYMPPTVIKPFTTNGNESGQTSRSPGEVRSDGTLGPGGNPGPTTGVKDRIVRMPQRITAPRSSRESKEEARETR